MAESKQSDVKSLSFEDAMKELESIVAKLEQGDVPLNESIAIYERGDALKKHCDGLLKAAETKIDKITADSSGNATGTEPLDVD